MYDEGDFFSHQLIFNSNTIMLRRYRNAVNVLVCIWTVENGENDDLNCLEMSSYTNAFPGTKQQTRTQIEIWQMQNINF